jgi:hypothetical protein
LIAASCSDDPARTSAITSSGEKTSMSPLRRNAGLSTSAAGLTRSPYSFRARLKIPCISTSDFVRVLDDRSTPASQRSIIGVVIDSIGS